MVGCTALPPRLGASRVTSLTRLTPPHLGANADYGRADVVSVLPGLSVRAPKSSCRARARDGDGENDERNPSIDLSEQGSITNRISGRNRNDAPLGLKSHLLLLHGLERRARHRLGRALATLMCEARVTGGRI